MQKNFHSCTMKNVLPVLFKFIDNLITFFQSWALPVAPLLTPQRNWRMERVASGAKKMWCKFLLSPLIWGVGGECVLNADTQCFGSGFRGLLDPGALKKVKNVK